jgi:hypothetical protein
MKGTVVKSFLIFAVLLMLPFKAQAEDRFDIAITVDDLPLQGTLTPGLTRLQIAQSYLRTLKSHGVPEAYGFINGAKLKTAPEGAAVYDLWVSEGYPLGNHGFTHLNLNAAASFEDWVADIEGNEPDLKSRIKGDAWRVFRFPNLTGGGHTERHDHAIAYLTQHHYRTAEVTVSFSDWAYGAAYNRCLIKGDVLSITQIETQYLRQVDDGITRMKTLSRRVYGRVIPQVLLTHLSGWSAHMLPEVLNRRWRPVCSAPASRGGFCLQRARVGYWEQSHDGPYCGAQQRCNR